MSIIPFLRGGVFDSGDVRAMSMAERIVALARNGERSPTLLRDRVLREASLGDGTGATDGEPDETTGSPAWSAGGP